MICFFGNVELHSTDSETHENDIDESDDDDEELAENNDNSNISEFSVELSDTDQKEQKSQSDFKDKKTCGCVRLYGKPCSCRVDWIILTEYRANCLETSKNDMDLIIKVQLFHHRNNSIETVAKKNTKQKKETTILF